MNHLDRVPVDEHSVVLSSAPTENYSRPAIDPLYRSAAAAFDGGATGVILSGRLDDGTAGTSAIARSGGTTIVQDPEEALFSQMPPPNRGEPGSARSAREPERTRLPRLRRTALGD